MNIAQFQSLIRAALLGLGTLIVNKGITDSATWTTVVGIIVGRVF